MEMGEIYICSCRFSRELNLRTKNSKPVILLSQVKLAGNVCHSSSKDRPELFIEVRQ